MNELEKYKQEHLIKYIDLLNGNQKENLLKEIKSINFELMSNLYKSRNETTENLNNEISPLTPVELSSDESKRLFEVGLNSIRNNEVAVVLMAGGQGTRLGHDGPKGTYSIGLPSGKSLFNIQCDKLKRLYTLTGVYIPWYIMTSEDNHVETIQHFEENDYFSYDKNSIVFFKQDRLPLMLENGQIALKSKYEINFAANGNGGVFSSLNSSGLLKKMNLNGVKWVFLYGVDNILAKLADPTFVGFTIESNLEISSKAVDKTFPEEKVGLICYRNGHPDIVEYSEMDEDLKNQYDINGKLKYRNGNILSHIFSLDFLIKCSNRSIPYHTAHKKVEYFENNSFQSPTSPNGYKFELFMFDVFKFTSDMAVLTVKREEEFAPVKNSDGKDSPASAKRLLTDLHYKWLTEAGFEITDELKSHLEIDSSLTYNGENLKGKNLEDIIY